MPVMQLLDGYPQSTVSCQLLQRSCQNPVPEDAYIGPGWVELRCATGVVFSLQ